MCFQKEQMLCAVEYKTIILPQIHGGVDPAPQLVVDGTAWEQREGMNPPRLPKCLKLPLKCTEMREPHSLQDER